MNTQLYNTLVRAKNFLITVEKNEEDLELRRGRISVTNTNPYVLTPKEMHKEFNWLIFMVLLMFVGPFALIYSFYIYNHNRKAKKKLRHLDELINSEENIKRTKENERDVEEQKKEYETKRMEYGRFFSENYPKYSYIFAYKIKTVEHVKDQIKYVSGVIEHVKNGASTLSEAQQRYGEDLRFIAEIEESREQREAEERRYKEEMKALDTIAKNQERTNDELNRIYRDTFLKRH